MSPLTKAGKDLISNYMYNKGKEFLASAILLRNHGRSTHVATHLICQSTELIFKSLLLFKDYDKFKPKLKKQYGHDLVKLIEEWRDTLNRKKIDSKFHKEILELNKFYRTHGLRYGSLTDIFIETQSLKTRETRKYLTKLVKREENKRAI